MQNKLEPKYLFPIFLLCLIVGSAVVFASHTVRGIFDFNDVKTKVFLPPRMSDSDMRFITEYLSVDNRTAAEGLTVYNTDTDSLNYWNGSEWRSSVDPDAGSAIPSASVIMWSGPTLPTDGKWKYCDGANTNGGAYAYDTPNMIGRFARGVDAADTGALLDGLGEFGGNSTISFHVTVGLTSELYDLSVIRIKSFNFTGTDGLTTNVCGTGNQTCGVGEDNGTSMSILPPYRSLYYICMI